MNCKWLVSAAPVCLLIVVAGCATTGQTPSISTEPTAESQIDTDAATVTTQAARMASIDEAIVKLSPALRTAYERDEDSEFIDLADTCSPNPKVDTDDRERRPIRELLVSFDERMPDFGGIAPDSFILTERDVDGFFAVWRSRGRSDSIVAKEDLLRFSGHPRVIHVEVNCTYLLPRLSYERAPNAIVTHPASPCTSTVQACAVFPTGAYPPNDKFYLDRVLWGLDSVRAHEPWKSGVSKSDTLIAVIDSGVNFGHEDLKAMQWTNTGEVANNGIDDDLNGYIDDKHGFAFANDCDPSSPQTTKCTPYPATDHGTFVTSVIASHGNNAPGNDTHMVGVVWESRIAAIRVGTQAQEYTVSQLAAAIGYARRIGAKVINISLAGDLPPINGGNSSPFCANINCCAWSYAVGNQINLTPNALFVIAAGDTPHPKYPAACPNSNILSVSGVVPHDCAQNQAQRGAYIWHPTDVDIGAPSEKICGICTDYYCEQWGVSFAAPFATGAAALLWSRTYATYWTAEMVKKKLMKHSRWSLDLDGNSVSGGTLDLSFLSEVNWDALELIRLYPEDDE